MRNLIVEIELDGKIFSEMVKGRILLVMIIKTLALNIQKNI